PADSFVTFSSDRSQVAFVAHKGNLRNNTVEYSLEIFAAADAFKAPRPIVVAEMASSSNRPAIRAVRWLADNRTLVFIGARPAETPQLYRVDMRTRQLRQLTHHPTPVVDYSIAEHADRFIYIAQAKPQPAISDEARRDGFFVTSQRWDVPYTNRRRGDSRHEI